MTLAELGVERIEVIDLRPDDVVVVTMTDALATAENVARLREALATTFGERRVLVKQRSIDVAVYRPEDVE